MATRTLAGRVSRIFTLEISRRRCTLQSPLQLSASLERHGWMSFSESMKGAGWWVVSSVIPNAIPPCSSGCDLHGKQQRIHRARHKYIRLSLQCCLHDGGGYSKDWGDGVQNHLWLVKRDAQSKSSGKRIVQETPPRWAPSIRL